MHKKSVVGVENVDQEAIEDCVEALKKVHEALQKEKRDNAFLQDMITDIHNSSSWKLTAPLRYLSRKPRKLWRIVRKARSYQMERGNLALIAAIVRRLRFGGMPVTGSSISNLLTHYGMLQKTFHFDVIFCIGCWEGESKRYRVYNLAEGLESLGFSVKIMPFSDVAEIAHQNLKVTNVVLFRAPHDTSVDIDEFLKYSKERGITVFYDIDDLVFEPDLVDQIAGFHELDESNKANYRASVEMYRKLLLMADHITVPTKYLSQQVEALGKKTSVIPNSLNNEQISIAAQLGKKPKSRDGDCIRICYLSGSKTHQVDFEQCAASILQIMKNDPRVVLRIVGYLDLDERWDMIMDRVERLEFLPYQSMLTVLSECDINIAPLELNSPFCDSKSELKFFEAGLLAIPTVASATDTYQRAISDGIDGFLAHTIDDWTNALLNLVTSAELRTKIGANAHQTAMSRYAIDEVAKSAALVFGLRQPQIANLPSSISSSGINSVGTLSSGKLSISWVIPGLIIGGGGHRNILRAAYFLEQFGHKVSLYFVGTEEDADVIKAQIQKHFYPINCSVYLFQGKIHPCDVVFATHWSTVNAAMTASGIAREIMYFVQDFEPSFAAMGSEYVLAENTYRLGLYHITSGPWCEALLRRDFDATADHFQFPVDKSIYYPRKRAKENRNLVFFAKPEMPRRCFELGIMALREFHNLRPDVEIVMFGSKHASKQSYDFPVTFREILPTLNDLAQMYSDGDVGLVFSTTNPSLIPYEMMACGLPVVDLARGDNAVNYAGRTDIALLADALPPKMAEQIAELIDNPAELASRRENGLAFIGSFPSEEGMARRIEELIIKRLEGGQ